MDGVETSRATAEFWARWEGLSFLAVGVQGPVLGVPAMRRLARTIHGCPPLVLADAGHFTQEGGDVLACAALEFFAARTV